MLAPREMTEMEWSKQLWPILRWVLIVAAVYSLSIRLFENGAIYFPEPYPATGWEPEKAGLLVEDCYFPTMDGVLLHAWYVPAKGDFTLLYLHGNAGNITNRLEPLLRLRTLPAGILIVDYRGYGRSQGKPSEAGLYLDADAAYRYLTETKHAPPQRLILLGESLGTAVAVELATRHPVAGLILEAPFPSARDVARRSVPLPFAGFLIRTKFDSTARIASVNAPILMVHGERDSTIPIDLGRKLFAAAREPKFFYALSQADHNDISLVGGEAYSNRIREFLDFVRRHTKPPVEPMGG